MGYKVYVNSVPVAVIYDYSMLNVIKEMYGSNAYFMEVE